MCRSLGRDEERSVSFHLICCLYAGRRGALCCLTVIRLSGRSRGKLSPDWSRVRREGQQVKSDTDQESWNSVWLDGPTVVGREAAGIPLGTMSGPTKGEECVIFSRQEYTFRLILKYVLYASELQWFSIVRDSFINCGDRRQIANIDWRTLAERLKSRNDLAQLTD